MEGKTKRASGRGLYAEGDKNPHEHDGTVLETKNPTGTKKLYIESYGCQMNFSDSEIVASVLGKEGYSTTQNPEEADLVLLNTCSIRDKAEQTVRNRLNHFNGHKRKNPDMKIGVLGCMAERVKGKLLDEEKLVDLVVGPDAYKDGDKFPSGPYCKEGDFVIFRSYSGTRFKIEKQEFRLINDDTVEAVVDDPRGYTRA